MLDTFQYVTLPIVNSIQIVLGTTMIVIRDTVTSYIILCRDMMLYVPMRGQLWELLTSNIQNELSSCFEVRNKLLTLAPL